MLQVNAPALKKYHPKLIVVSAPSGGGKTTICNALLRRDPRLVRSISATTRAPRGRERDGRDYYFMSGKVFARHLEQGRFLEWATVHGHHYGTLKNEVKRQTTAGKDVLLVIDVQGGMKVKEQMPAAVLIFLRPPSLEALEARLRGRATDTSGEIAKRLRNARWEMRQARAYDYVVVNDELPRAIADVQAIIRAERLKIN